MGLVPHRLGMHAHMLTGRTDTVPRVGLEPTLDGV